MRGIPCAGVVCLVLLAVAGAQAQTGDPDDLQQKVDSTVEVARDTQEKLDDWSVKKAELELRYRTAQANIEYLRERLDRQRDVAGSLDGQVAELDRRLVESTRLQAVIQDTLNAVLGRFEKVVARDLPFLPEEREQRLDTLRRLNARSDVQPAEKLRRLLEAMLIEAQYGETVEVAPQAIDVGGREIHADVLRVGRLAMYWRSPDGGMVGTWDPLQETWVELDGGYNRVVSRAMEMASRMRPTEIVSLPLGRITP